jgi:GH43 family beta-xylosidase
MDNNSFSFMKQGFDWQSAQSKDMKEIRNDAIYEEERERRAGITAWTEDRHNSDEEELRRESKELRDYNDFFDMEDR